ncbi:17293_t:CDS:2 [Entrophospora sp. SA101]|nr:17293_t:CDS:2 [Entrophospora sp. SA101]
MDKPEKIEKVKKKLSKEELLAKYRATLMVLQMKIFTGTVISLKNAKTATVELIFNKLHPKYHKPIKSKKKVQAHNEEYELELGDKVVIKSSRPYSTTKRFLSILSVADNSGAKKILVIRCLGGSNRRYSRVGDLVKATVKKADPHANIKKSQIVTAFSKNYAVLVKEDGKEPVGTRIFVPLLAEFDQ